MALTSSPSVAFVPAKPFAATWPRTPRVRSLHPTCGAASTPTHNTPPDLLGDGVRVGHPDERLRVAVVLGDEAVDRLLQGDQRVERAATEAPAGELGEEGLDALSHEEEVGVKWNWCRFITYCSYRRGVAGGAEHDVGALVSALARHLGEHAVVTDDQRDPAALRALDHGNAEIAGLPWFDRNPRMRIAIVELAARRDRR